MFWCFDVVIEVHWNTSICYCWTLSNSLPLVVQPVCSLNKSIPINRSELRIKLSHEAVVLISHYIMDTSQEHERQEKHGKVLEKRPWKEWREVNPVVNPEWIIQDHNTAVSIQDFPPQKFLSFVCLPWKKVHRKRPHLSFPLLKLQDGIGETKSMDCGILMNVTPSFYLFWLHWC